MKTPAGHLFKLQGTPRIALLTEWLTVYGGAERVLEEIIKIFPEADLFALIDILPQDSRKFIQDKHSNTSFLQNYPFKKKLYRHYLPFMPAAAESLDLRGYDLVISCSHAVMKGVLTTPDQLHVCYLQARTLKYLYEDRHYYPHKYIPLIRSLISSQIRCWDAIASHRPDVTIANSDYVRSWYIHRHNIDTSVVYPPVNTELFLKVSEKNFQDEAYVTVARLEPYKRVDIIIDAFVTLGKPLIVIGDGTERARLEARSSSNIRFVGYLSSDQVASVVARSQAFVYAASEDFGIALVEAQAAGIPVITRKVGGGVETVSGLGEHENPTGLFYEGGHYSSLVSAIERFEAQKKSFEKKIIKNNAKRFDIASFHSSFFSVIEKAWTDFINT